MQRGFVTFGCFNNPSKYSPQTFDAWAAILRRVPTARLHLKYGGLEHPPLQDRLRSQFAQRGIAAERISFEGWTPATELMASYHQIDLALDTQPYSGGVTTCEALWMGVPVIAYAGETFCGRHAVSHLANAGFAQFVAADAAEYVELAVQWALRLSELSALRTTMRDQMRHSPLCDAPCFARDFLDLLIRAWISGAG
ncbi:MAG: hypothetical protein JF612_13095 [Planctomycetia bacterium]|nr:hypothetical protein [Planctomycetia bacterium]